MRVACMRSCVRERVHACVGACGRAGVRDLYLDQRSNGGGFTF